VLIDTFGIKGNSNVEADMKILKIA